MSLATDAPPDRAAARRAGLFALLPLEVLWVTIRFDTESLQTERTWWADLIGESYLLPQIALTVGIAVAVFAGARVRREFADVMARYARPAFPWAALALHLASFAAFALLTRGLLEGDLRSSPRADFWGAAWFAAAAATGVFWLGALVPFHVWGALARRLGGSVGAAAGAGLLAWGASRTGEDLWPMLGECTYRAVAWGLGLVCGEVVTSPAERVIGTPAYSVYIAPSCSGCEGLGLVLALLGCYLWLCRDTLRFPRALLLVPLGLAVAWVANAARITALIAIGSWGWPGVARGGFHSQAGWLAFNAVALGLIGLGRTRVFSRREATTRDEPQAGTNPAVPYLLPLVAVVGTAMVTGALSEGGLDRLYPVRVLAAVAVVWVFRREYARLGWRWSWAAVGAGLAVFAAWLGLEALLPPAAEAAEEAPTQLPAGWAAAWLVARVLGAVVTVPLAEELAFRGYLLRRLQGAAPDEDMTGRWDWPAVLISSVLFGVLHPGRWVAGTLAGVMYAWVFTRRGRLADAVIAHAVTNAALAAYVLTTGHWSLW